MSRDREYRARVFADVYTNNGWGRAPDGRPFYSDSPAKLTEPIRVVVSDFIKARSIQSVVDLGCGDFELASGIDMHGATYVGVDIVPELIAWNRAQFERPDRQFVVADIVEDALPDAELCMIQTVLYILSEQDVRRVLAKLGKYRYVIATDGQPHIPEEARRNIDKKTDKYTRHDYYNNGFYLELPPYNLNIEVLLEHQLPSGEIMRTVLLNLTAPTAVGGDA
jgi:SAM-dependent methyltransferase